MMVSFSTIKRGLLFSLTHFIFSTHENYSSLKQLLIQTHRPFYSSFSLNFGPLCFSEKEKQKGREGSKTGRVLPGDGIGSRRNWMSKDFIYNIFLSFVCINVFVVILL